jgi:hypothetical protein
MVGAFGRPFEHDPENTPSGIDPMGGSRLSEKIMLQGIIQTMI